MTEFSQSFRIISPFAGCKTTLFVVWNSKLNHYFVLAKDKDDALSILEKFGHVINRKLARIGEACEGNWAPEMQKFFASAAQASAKGAQGIVTNMNGFAVMKHGGSVYMPMSVVDE